MKVFLILQKRCPSLDSALSHGIQTYVYSLQSVPLVLTEAHTSSRGGSSVSTTAMLDSKQPRSGGGFSGNHQPCWACTILGCMLSVSLALSFHPLTFDLR